MATATFERQLRALNHQLHQEDDPLTVDLYACGKDVVLDLQRASASHTQDFLALIDRLIQRAYEGMRTENGREPSFSWRRLYTDASIIWALSFVVQSPDGSDISKTTLEAISKLDHAIVIAGGPGEGRMDLIHQLIATLQTTLLSSTSQDLPIASVKAPTRALSSIILSTASRSIPRLEKQLSFLEFSRHSSQPFILPSFVADWPCMTDHPWCNFNYLRTVAGPGRVVPVEVGDDYRTDDWTQSMMKWEEFLSALKDNSGENAKPTRMLYLAQHNLFMQFPALRDDICIPDYVYASLPAPQDYPEYRPPKNDDQLVVNAWLGPRGTVSPAHTDPFFNFYAQIVGRKTVWLAPPSVSPSMYSFDHSSSPQHSTESLRNPAENHEAPSMSNTSRLDVFVDGSDAFAESRNRFPLFWENVVDGAMFTTLEPGDLLFFPPGWWHAMRSEETSFSVSIWF